MACKDAYGLPVRNLTILSARKANGEMKIPKVICNVKKVHFIFSKYGRIDHVIGHQATSAHSRDYYITFEDATAAEQARAEIRQRTLLLKLKEPTDGSILSRYGEFLARFSQDETTLPNGSEYLASTHPSSPSAILRLAEANCHPVVEPVPQVTHPSMTIQDPADQLIPKPLLPTSQLQRFSKSQKRTVKRTLLQATDLLKSLMPSSRFANSAYDMLEASRQLTVIESAFVHEPILSQDPHILSILAKLSHIPDSIIQDGDSYSTLRRLPKRHH
ncbi:hypothetical protein DL93DRAFT_2234734 [Clavulina sp. PMI_390]|nr:hypothetical protein DL93DRAFT_2234734 [Clavulina sp. PMI_390]